MNRHRLLPALTLCLLAATHATAAEEFRIPEGTVVEAEDAKGAASYAKVVEDAEASGGKAVTSGQEWKPVFRGDIADDLPDRVLVHVRRKGGPIQLKARVDGKNEELKWDWGKPDAYEWAEFGPYNREELGSRIELMRGKGDAAPHVDVVVFASADGGAAPAKAATEEAADGDGEAASAIVFPAGAGFEAEAAKGADKYANVVDDAEASGGKAVTSGAEWKPVFRHELGEGLSDRVVIHVRRKGGPIQLKAKVGGKSEELEWDWGKPDAYAWTTFGPYDRAELGASIELIRGKGDTPPHVDAVVIGDPDAPVDAAAGIPDTPQTAAEAGITEDAEADTIPPFRPAADAGTGSAALAIDWSDDAGTLTGRHWGLSLFHAVDGKAADDAAYVDFLASVEPGSVRLHRSKLGTYWMNENKKSFDDGEPVWNRETVARALAPRRRSATAAKRSRSSCA